MSNLRSVKTLTLVPLVVALTALPAQAEIEFNIGFFSDYLLDGESASDKKAVVQGDITYVDPAGYYLGLFGSTLGSGNGLELDLYTGVEFSAAVVDFDLGYTYYHYAKDDDYGEINAYANLGPVYTGFDYTLHAKDSDARGDMIYRLGGEYEFVPTLVFDAEVGRFNPDAKGVSSHDFWMLGVTKVTDYGDFSVSYGSTSESGSDDIFAVGYSIGF